MSTYKVLQDIEADDKLLGPLTFRQFVYAGIAALNLYLCFLAVTKGFAIGLIIFLPFAIVGGFFAWPWGGDQPTEVWALAKIRFIIKPRKRIWNQSGIKELVTITAPKKIERVLTNGLTQSEVRNRLNALADTVDTRGWAIKNVGVGAYMQPVAAIDFESDRLVNMSTLPQPVANDDIKASDDMLDVKNNRVAQNFDTMIAASAKAHRQEIMDRMQQTSAPIAPPPKPAQLQPKPANNYWFLNEPSQTGANVPGDNVTFNTQVVTPGTPTSDLPVTAANPTADEEAFIREHKNEPAFSPNMHGHLHVIQPLSAQQATAQTPTVPGAQAQQPQIPIPAQPQAPVTAQADTGILDLARNDDLNVATIAREAQKRKESSQDEVVISLH